MWDGGKDQQQTQHGPISPPQLAPALDISSPLSCVNGRRENDVPNGDSRTARAPASMQDSPDTVMYERTVNSIYESYARAGEGGFCFHNGDEKPSAPYILSSRLKDYSPSPRTSSGRIDDERIHKETYSTPTLSRPTSESPGAEVHRTFSKYSFASDTDLLPPDDSPRSPNNLQVRNNTVSRPVSNCFSSAGTKPHNIRIQQRVPLYRQGTDDGMPHLVEGKCHGEEKVTEYHLDYAGDDKKVNGGKGREQDNKSLEGGKAHASEIDHQDARLPRKKSIWGRYFPGSKFTRWFLLLVIVETLVNISIEANLLFRFNHALESSTATSVVTRNEVRLPVYLSIFAMAHIFQLVLAFDAAIFRNTIQIIGLSIFNGLFLLYAVIQMGEIKQILGTAQDGSRITGETAYSVLHVPVTMQTAIILGVTAAAEVGFGVLSWFIYKDFGWETYKDLGANLSIKRYHLHYQIFVCLIRFASFFFVGFGVQFIFLVLPKSDPEYYITIAALPVSVLLLLMGAFGAGYENVWAMSGFIVGMLIGLGYFLFKIYRIFNQRETYQQVYKSLTTFAGLSVLILAVSLIWAVVVMSNFRNGLREQRIRAKMRKGKGGRKEQQGKVDERDGQGAGHLEMNSVRRRMTLE